MKKTMKSISILLTLMFLVTGLCVIPVSAADVTYSVSPAIGATGETVSVSVSLSTSVDLWGSNVQLKYNPAELQVVECAKGGIVSSGSINDSGTSVNFSGMYSAKSGTIFTVQFKILKESGKASLTLSSSENTDVNSVTYDDIAISNGSITVLNKVPVEKVTLDKTSLSLKKGEKAKITATVSPANTTSSGISFYSSDDDIATVSDDGTITAVKGGTATITALAGEKSAKCTVTVSVPMTGTKADGGTTKKMAVGDTVNLTVLKVPSDATDKVTASWTSSNPQVASVKAGTVTAVSVGEATITATVNKWTVTYKITVTEKTDESTTAVESTTDESTTVPESTTDVFATEPTTRPIFTTVPTTKEEFSLVEPIINGNLNGDNGKNNERYKQLLVIASAVVVVVVIGTVSFFVLKGYRGKNKKQRIIVEEKFRR